MCRCSFDMTAMHPGEIDQANVKKTVLIVLLMLLAGAVFPPAAVELEYFEVEQQGPEFVVKWKASVEQDVHSYVLTHKTSLSNEQFIEVFAADAHGPMKEYSFRDDQVYKAGAEKLDYRLQAVYSNGVREVIATKSLNYTSTAIRRTWGSLKAMFQ